MSITVVNEWWFKKDGDIEEGKAAALELVEHFRKNVPEVQLSLWIEDEDDPYHHFHITVFDNKETILEVRESKAIEHFIKRLWPQIIRDETFKSPNCKTWLNSIGNLKEIGLNR